jgi:DNA-binding MarR family transcriptional regulator
MDGSVPCLAEALVDFMPQFNDKLVSLFPPSPAAVEGLSKSQVRVLMLLRRRPGGTATELGEGLNMTKANLTVILDELESRGFAQRSADPEDRRKLRLDLSAAGRKSADAIALELEKVLEARIAPLAAGDREALARALASATAILEKL